MSLLTDDDRYELTLNSEGGKPMNMREMPDRVEARDLQEAEPRLILFYSIVSQSMLLSKNRALPVSGHQFWNKGFSNTHIYFKKVNEISFPETSGNENAPIHEHQNEYPFSPGNPSAGVHILS